MYSPEKRSEIMSRIRGKNTRAEVLVFRYLRKEKIYFQPNYKRAPGKPDIALPRKKKAVFIDGDFWHGRRLAETIERLPSEYWKNKIQSNIERDNRVNSMLKDNGWLVLRVWESDINRKRTRDQVLSDIKEFIINGTN